MKSKAQKTKELDSLKSKLPESSITVFTTFAPSTGKAGEKGLSVAQMQTLKRSMRPLDSEYVITKKTLIDRALKSNSKDSVDIYGMEGSVGLALGPPAGRGDAYAIAKNLYDFAKKNPALKFWGALFEGKFLNVDGFMEMAKMPPKEVLIGRLVGMLTYPMRGLAVALSEIGKKK